jgi:hypothetical protein
LIVTLDSDSGIFDHHEHAARILARGKRHFTRRRRILDNVVEQYIHEAAQRILVPQHTQRLHVKPFFELQVAHARHLLPLRCRFP